MAAGVVIDILKRPLVGLETIGATRTTRTTVWLAATIVGAASSLAVFNATRSWEWAILVDLAVMAFAAASSATALPLGPRQAALAAGVLPASAAAAYALLAWIGVLPAVGLTMAFAASYVAQLLVPAVLTGPVEASGSRLGALLDVRARAGLRGAHAMAAATVGVTAGVCGMWAAGGALVVGVLVASAVALALARPVPRVRSRHGVVRVAGRLAAAPAALGLVLVGGLLVLALQPYTPMLGAIAVVALGIAVAKLAWRPFGIGLAALLVVAAIPVAGSQLMTSTPAVVDASGASVPGSIASIDRITLGGVDQTIVVRGRSTANPVLLFLSGGPGPTQLAWHRQYLTELEDRFTVVYWEQRGSGRSGGLALADWARMTPEQYAADGLELTAYLRQRFGQDRVYVAGQSWGTMLGVWMVQRRPEWFVAYVGIGQMTNPVEDDRLIYEYVLDRAREAGDAGFVQMLEAQGPPPYHGFLATTRYGSLFARAKEYEQALVAASNPEPIAPLVAMTETPEYGLADMVAAYLNGAVTFARVYDQLDSVDFDSQVPRLEVPVYLAEGRWDTNAMPELAVRWFDRLQAPSKTLVWFEHSGHNPEHEEPAAFIEFMVGRVLGETR